jgi:RNA polymerase sigma factor (sigma-70 family)
MNELREPTIVLGMNGSLSSGVAMIQRDAVRIVTAEDRFADLTLRHLDEAYRLAWAILGDPGDADDATQDAFALAWRKRSSLREPARFDAWFGRILVNVCRERLRRRSRERGRVEPIEVEPAVADTTDPISRRDAILRAIDRLGPDQRVVVVLRFWADLTIDQIAERLDVPLGTVKSRLHYALAAIRPGLEDVR